MANELNLYRKASGLTVPQLAARTGYSVSHMYKVMQGIRTPGPRCLSALARAFELPVKTIEEAL